MPTAPFLAQFCTRKRRAEVGSPFHKTLLSSKTCGFMSCANHTSPRARQCQLPSIVKEPSLQSLTADQSVSVSNGAQTRFGADLRNLRPIKNPASSAGRIRLSFGPLFPRGLRRMNSKLNCGLSGARNQSHLCFQKARLGIRTALTMRRAPPTSKEYSKSPDFVKCPRIIFFTAFCGFQFVLWKRRKSCRNALNSRLFADS